MLTGKESLMRLIGKRKKNLSAQTSSLFLSDQAKNCSPLIFKEVENDCNPYFAHVEECSLNQETRKSKEQQQRWQENHKLEWVTCPVCASVIRGADYTVNSHLDACLRRGKKKKLTQRTLLQFGFSSISKDSTLNRPDTVKDHGKQGGFDYRVEPVAVAVPPKASLHERKETNKCLSQSISFWLPNPETYGVDSYENINREFATNCKGVNADTPKFLFEARMPAPNTSITEVGIIMKTLETYIVGCKFHGEVDIAQGDSISLSRDPENVKDLNAIKVLLADSGSGQMLGFLPRELAKYLAPLINKYYLQLKVASKLDRRVSPRLGSLL